MTADDLLALLPLLTLGACAILAMLAIAVRRDHAMIALWSAGSCLVTVATLPFAADAAPRAVTELLRIDGYALWYMGLLLGASACVIALAYHYFSHPYEQSEQFEEFYVLLLLATLGGLVLASAVHLASFFLGLEMMGVSLYCLIGFVRMRRVPLEAALKYLVLSATASAFLLFGIALMYFHTGTMAFARMGAALADSATPHPLWLAGFVMTVVAIGFKLGLVPFHLWVPDVYQGAPAPVTAYVATVSKGAMFALLLRLLSDVQALRHGALLTLFGVLAAASMSAGNLLALLQENVKRLLAYSSISHVGYLLVALLAGGPLAVEAVAFYLAAYVVTTVGAFGIVTVLSGTERDADALEDYRGLFWSRPWLAGTFMLMLLSLAGIPVTAGFVGKFYAIAAGVDAGLWVLVILLIVNSAIGLYYYLRVVVALFDQPAGALSWHTLRPPGRREWSAIVSLGVLVSFLLWLGLYPNPIIAFIRTMVSPLLAPVAQLPS